MMESHLKYISSRPKIRSTSAAGYTPMFEVPVPRSTRALAWLSSGLTGIRSLFYGVSRRYPMRHAMSIIGTPPDAPNANDSATDEPLPPFDELARMRKRKSGKD